MAPPRHIANGDLRVLAHGTRAQCEQRVGSLGLIDTHDGIERVYRLRRRSELPTRETFRRRRPASAQEKALPGFDGWWAAIENEQLALV